MTATEIKAANLLPTYFDNLYTTGSARAERTTATNKSKIRDFTLINIRTEIEIKTIYIKARFNSSCLVSPFGKFTTI